MFVCAVSICLIPEYGILARAVLYGYSKKYCQSITRKLALLSQWFFLESDGCMQKKYSNKKVAEGLLRYGMILCFCIALLYLLSSASSLKQGSHKQWYGLSSFSFITEIPTTLLKTSRNAFLISKTSKTTVNTDQPLSKTIGKKLVLELVLELRFWNWFWWLWDWLKLVWVVLMVRVVSGTNVLLTPRTTLTHH